MKALLLAVTAFAATGSDPTVVNGWSIFKNDNNCALMQSWDGDFLLYISHSEGDAYDSVMFTAPQFRSIEDGKKYPTKLSFVKGNRVDDDWGSIDMRGAVSETLKGVSFRLKSEDLLADFASSRLIVFERNDVIIASLKLEGSAEAVAALKKCAIQVEKNNPSVPFKD